jgi:hypothetical protein
MALLVDKHRPRSLESLTYHEDLSQRLKALVRLNDAIILKCLKLNPGPKRGLPSPSNLWTFRSRQKDSHRRDTP